MVNFGAAACLGDPLSLASPWTPPLPVFNVAPGFLPLGLIAPPDSDQRGSLVGEAESAKWKRNRQSGINGEMLNFLPLPGGIGSIIWQGTAAP